MRYSNLIITCYKCSCFFREMYFIYSLFHCYTSEYGRKSVKGKLYYNVLFSKDL